MEGQEGKMSLVRLRMDLAYDGGGFHGWARQPGLRTVQGCIEQALSLITGARSSQGGVPHNHDVWNQDWSWLAGLTPGSTRLIRWRTWTFPMVCSSPAGAIWRQTVLWPWNAV